ncbi:nucleotidyltransferase domain-containing protein [Paenisporosarcina antarctica]|uniref:Renal dipeptidase n=1 Tax=Paenisporosarcina antarctica TaxID=417367 RepID=A0A4P6ZZ34_9BACL|nr:nucleotidyltransferase family protein [Paenisporosarcina antarctica]QBP42000.1 Renal dipeptidase [Paenisporosarcina antarctica]
MNNNYDLDFSTIPKELTLLLTIMNTKNDDSDLRVTNELVTEVDWELFIQLAIHHRLYPLIYTKLIQMKEQIWIPQKIVQLLGDEYKKNTFNMLRLSGEMEQVSKLFMENQIKLIYLKGPVIATDIYGDISLRTSKDLDILITKTDLIRADELLLNSGYEREGKLNTFVGWTWQNHHVSYFHPQKRIQIEIHWRLHPFPNIEHSFNELWERKRVSKLTSYPVYFLGKEDLFSFLITHGNRHGWFRLRWLADIDQLIRNRISSDDTSYFLNMYDHHHLGQALILTTQLLKTPINKEMKTVIKGKRSRKLAQLAIFYIVEMGDLQIKCQSQITVVKDHKNNHFSFLIAALKSIFSDRLFSMMSNVQKFIVIVKLFYPKPADTNLLKLPKPLYFLYFPLRPFLWAWRKSSFMR